MVEVECTTARPGGVTLVAVRLDNRVEAAGVDAHRVRLAPRLDGPVWPPREEGVPAGPWEFPAEPPESRTRWSAPLAGRTQRSADESPRAHGTADGRSDPVVEVVVPTGRVGSVGFASPAEPTEPPVEVVDVAPAEPEAAVDPSPADVLRVLGDPSPPRDAVTDRAAGAREDSDDVEERVDAEERTRDRPPDDAGDPW